MKKYSRNQRVSAITKILIENPNKIINLNYFTSKFNAAKSTISEDIVIVKDTFSSFSMGKVETVSGAAGGVKYICGIDKKDIKDFAEELCLLINKKDRIIPGDFLYLTDVMCDPIIISKAGRILAAQFSNLDIDYVVTVETKGIPLAYEVARMLGVELIIVRRQSMVTEGSTVSINYVSGSTKALQTMTLSKKSMKAKSKSIFIDDFMKAGGTAIGIVNLLKEFDSELLGIGVLIDNIEMKKKLVSDYISVVEFNGFNENREAILQTSRFVNEI
ncbi:MAG: pur operon repressor [Clostridiaceae bacterium]